MASTAPQKKTTTKVASKTSLSKAAPKSAVQKTLSSVKSKASGSKEASSAAKIASQASVSSSKVSSPANTDEKTIVVKTIGMVLKQVRESKSLSVSDISQRLRISERYLHGIESMDASSIPEKVYALGFVRSYAQHLGIDPEKSLTQFKNEMYGAKPSGSEKKLKIPMPVDRTHMPSAKIMLFSAFVLFSFLVVFGYWKQQKKIDLIVEDEISTLLNTSSDVVSSAKSLPIAPLKRGADSLSDVSPLSSSKEDTHHKISEIPVKTSADIMEKASK